MPVVVVGIDGSPGADSALEFAAEEARLRRAVLRAVCTWEVPTMAYASAYPPPTLSEDLEKDANKVVEETLERIKPEGDITVERRVVEGQPAEAILHAAEGADLI